ncbi:MAG TPA: MFS transporter [Leadbetterella sp.]|nr:MFS transporter [Leadbetterella sp.]
MEIKPLSSYQKFVMAMLAITQFTVVLDFMVMSPLGDILMKSLVISPKQFGIAVSSYAFSAGISGLLAAGFADKFDRKKLLVFFYLGFIVGTFLCGIAPTYHTLVAARIFTGIFGGVMGSINMAIITDIFELNQRGRVMGVVQMGFAASQVLGIPIGLYFANLWGWHAPFIMIVVVAVVIVLVLMLKLKPVTAHLNEKSERNVWAHFRHVLLLKNYRIAFLSTALLSIGGYLMMPFGSAFAVNNLGVTQEELPLIFMLTGVSSLVFMPLVGKLSDRYDKFKIFAIGSIWAVILTLIYTNLPASPLYLIITLNILLFMGISSRMIPSTTLTSAIPNLQDRGAFMSINSSLQQIAGGLATMLAGLIIVQKDKDSPLENYPVLGIIGSVFILLTVWFIYRVYRIVKNQKAQPK